jgi:protein MpaA
LALATTLLAAASPPAAAAERSTIGDSVRGRAIVAVRDGEREPAFRVLVVGSIHGDERAGIRVARRLIRAGAPRRAELWVVPTLNPDGTAAGTRGNAHGVDLNRNFPFDWQPLGGGEYSGRGPLSEPESRAARRFILRIRPDLTIWLHQPFGLVDRAGNDRRLERRLAELTGLPLVHLPGRYPGSASRWQNHALPDSTAFVLELPATVRPPLARRTANAIRILTAERASPEIAPRRPAAGDERQLRRRIDGEIDFRPRDG